MVFRQGMVLSSREPNGSLFWHPWLARTSTRIGSPFPHGRREHRSEWAGLPTPRIVRFKKGVTSHSQYMNMMCPVSLRAPCPRFGDVFLPNTTVYSAQRRAIAAQRVAWCDSSIGIADTSMKHCASLSVETSWQQSAGDADGFRRSRCSARRSGGRRRRLEHGTAAERRRDVDEAAASGGGHPLASHGSAAATHAATRGD
jgi:hypothetical protein